MRTVKKLVSIDELVRRFPLSPEGREGIARDRDEVRAILGGRDPRFLVVVGPCSAWPAEAVYEYARRLKDLSREVGGQLKLVLRLYVQKPRTTRGWTGPINQPDPFTGPDVEHGMAYARSLMVRVVELGLPIADEALFTHNAGGFVELLSWVAIGARSTEDQEHRIWASAVAAPVGMKNPTSGDIAVGTNSVLAAQHPHTAVFDGYQVETDGNPYAHLVLRGGRGGPNYHLSDLYHASERLRKLEIDNPALLVDASHDNSRIHGLKDPRVQVDVVREVLDNLRVHRILRDTVRGFLIESFIETGSQRIEACTPRTVDRGGLSITDPCLGWGETRELVLDMAEKQASMVRNVPRRAAP